MDASPLVHRCSLMLPRYRLVFEGRDARPEGGTDSNNNSYFLSRSSNSLNPLTTL